MVLLIKSDINRYIPIKSVNHNICYFKYAFKLQLGDSSQWSFLSPKSQIAINTCRYVEK